MWATTPLDILDVPRIIPADLCEPYGSDVPRSGTAPRVVPAPAPKPRATRKPPAPKPVRETAVSPEPRNVVPIVPEPARKAQRGYRPEPCGRCGRSDFKTDKGRAWHLENNTDCAKYAKPERHAYVALAS